MSTFEKTFTAETAVFAVGDVLSLHLPVGNPGPDGQPLLRPAVVAAVSDCLGETSYELVPAAIGDDLPAHKTDITTGVLADDGAETLARRFVPDLGLKVCASAPVMAGVQTRTGRLPQAAHAALVADAARRARAGDRAARPKDIPPIAAPHRGGRTDPVAAQRADDSLHRRSPITIPHTP